MNIEIEVEWKATHEWLDRVRKGVEDARPLWKGITPILREWTANEFAGGNPNRWMKLTPKYKAWKAKEGYPTKIGTMKGKLADASSEGAIVNYNYSSMTFQVDTSKTINESGDSYAKYFNKYRPLFRWTNNRIVSWLDGITMKYLNNLIRKAK